MQYHCSIADGTISLWSTEVGPLSPRQSIHSAQCSSRSLFDADFHLMPSLPFLNAPALSVLDVDLSISSFRIHLFVRYLPDTHISFASGQLLFRPSPPSIPFPLFLDITEQSVVTLALIFQGRIKKSTKPATLPTFSPHLPHSESHPSRTHMPSPAYPTP